MLLNKIVVIDFEKSKELVKKFNIENVPTCIVTNNDNPIRTFNGLFSFDELVQIIETEKIRNLISSHN